jgi:hypothetical protein
VHHVSAGEAGCYGYFITRHTVVCCGQPTGLPMYVCLPHQVVCALSNLNPRHSTWGWKAVKGAQKGSAESRAEGCNGM